MDSLDLVIKLATFGAMLLGAHVWVIKRIERGQDALKQHHSNDNQRLGEEIARTLKQITKKLKKKVSKKECKRHRETCPNCVKKL